MGEAATAFHHLDHATLDHIGRAQAFDAFAAQLDAALGHRAAFAGQQVAHRAQRGRLARPVAPHQRDDAALRHLQRHALQYEDHVVVDDLDAVDVEKDVFGVHGFLPLPIGSTARNAGGWPVIADLIRNDI